MERHSCPASKRNAGMGGAAPPGFRFRSMRATYFASLDPGQLQRIQTLAIRRKAVRLPSGFDLFQNCGPISLRVIEQASQRGAFVLYFLQVQTVLARIKSRDPRKQLARQGKVADQAGSHCRAIDVSAPGKIVCKEAMDVQNGTELRAQRDHLRRHKAGRRFDQRSKLLDALEFDVAV